MSVADAQAFLERVETDEAFASELDAITSDPPAVLARVRSAGFDVTETDVREAFFERYGADLSEEQLDAIAAGVDADGIAIAAAAGIVTGAVAVAAAGF